MLLAIAAGCDWDFRRSEPGIDYVQTYWQAKRTLLQAAESENWATRSMAIEALSRTLGEDAGDRYVEALRDPVPHVRHAAAMAIGDVEYAPAKPMLLQMAQVGDDVPHAEPDKRVFTGVVYALHRLGNYQYTSELGLLLFDDEPEVRSNAAMVMGRLGEPSARVPLRTRLQDEVDPSVQVDLVEAMAMLGDQQRQVMLEAYTKTQYLEDRLDAISALARIGTPRAPEALRSMTAKRQPPIVRVAAFEALARLGIVNEVGYELASRAVQQPRKMIAESQDADMEIPQIQADALQRMGALALGAMGDRTAVRMLKPLLNDTDGGVRVAAAMSIAKLLESYASTRPPAAGQAPQAPASPEGPTPDAAMTEPVAVPPAGENDEMDLDTVSPTMPLDFETSPALD
jgi:HEAT repeat protein